MATCSAVVPAVGTAVTPLIDLPPQLAYESTANARLADAEHSVDLLLSTGRLDGVRLWDTLAEASERGVAVRVLVDASDWAPEITEGNEAVISSLRARGVDARYDLPEITTHAKLLIIDRRIVVVGSSNWNRYALTEHRQASLLVEDLQVAAAFSEYFERLWNDELPPGGIELPAVSLPVEAPTLLPLPDTVDSTLYADVVLRCLHAARESVHVVMYRMSYYSTFRDSLSNQLLQALVGASRRGLDVRVILDDCAPYESSLRANLEAAMMLHFQGVEVRMDRPDVTTHAKLVVVDRETVFVGSTNWNYYSLEQNNEASVAVLGAPDVAAPFEAFFETLWVTCRALP